MKKTYFGDWNRNFLPISNQFTALNLNSKIPLNNILIYKELDFSVNELSFNLGFVNISTVESYLNKCFSILKLISIILNKEGFAFETIYTTKETFLNKSEAQIQDFVLLLENGFTEKEMLNRINNLFKFKENKFKNLFSEIFRVNENEDNFIIYMYFISCFIEIYNLHNFMLKNNLQTVNLSSKNLSLTKFNSNNTYLISEIFLKGDSDNYVGCMHSYYLDLLDNKDFSKSFNTFMLNQRVLNKEFLIHDLSIYLNNSYFEMVDNCSISDSQKQTLKFLFNYIQYKVFKDSKDLLKEKEEVVE